MSKPRSKGEPDVKAVMANVGRGNPQIFYNQRNFDQRSNLGEVLVRARRLERPQGAALVERLRSELDANPDAQFVVKIFQNGPPIDAPIAGPRRRARISMCSKRLAREVERDDAQACRARATSSNPVAVDQPRLRLGLDTDKAALSALCRRRRAARCGWRWPAKPPGGCAINEGDSYNVVVRLPLDAAHEISALDGIYVRRRPAVPCRCAKSPPRARFGARRASAANASSASLRSTAQIAPGYPDRQGQRRGRSRR